MQPPFFTHIKKFRPLRSGTLDAILAAVPADKKFAKENTS